jgi:hypothetical protein
MHGLIIGQHPAKNAEQTPRVEGSCHVESHGWMHYFQEKIRIGAIYEPLYGKNPQKTPYPLRNGSKVAEQINGLIDSFDEEKALSTKVKNLQPIG